MKKLTSLLFVVGVLTTMSPASAAGLPFFHKMRTVSRIQLLQIGVPAQFSRPIAFQNGFTFLPAAGALGDAPAPMPMSVTKPQSQETHLYPCVEYEDLHNIHPCAVPKIIGIRDTRKCCDPCSCCCPPGCVYVKICVPPCGCLRVTVNKDCTRVKYDYGSYEVEIKSKRGIVYVDYDD